jgi:hypothetical protein
MSAEEDEKESFAHPLVSTPKNDSGEEMAEQGTIPRFEKRLISAIEKLATPSAGQLAMPSREDIPPEIATSHDSYSNTLTSPNSPRVNALTMNQVKVLIQSAIDEAKALPCPTSLWDRAFGPNPQESLIPTLERALAGISDPHVKYAVEPIETTKRDALDAQHGECCGLQKLADILEQRLGVLPTPPPSDSSECGDEERNNKDKDSIQQASKLEYKLVDET